MTANNPLTITSAGSVKATASGADSIDGGSVAWSINNSGTVASSQRYGISLHGAGSSIVNSGSISGYSGAGGYGLELDAGGTVTNTNITGGEDGIIVNGAAGTINNSGQIVSTFDDGASLFGGGSVINNAGAVIKAPTSGGYGPAAVYIPAGSANVVNGGSMSGQYGVYLGVAGTVYNNGTISGSSSAVDFAASSSANLLQVGRTERSPVRSMATAARSICWATRHRRGRSVGSATPVNSGGSSRSLPIQAARTTTRGRSPAPTDRQRHHQRAARSRSADLSM